MTGDRWFRGPLRSPLGRRLLAAFLFVALSSVTVLTAAALVGTARGLTSAQQSDRREAATRTAEAATRTAEAATRTAEAASAAYEQAGADLTAASAIAGAVGAGLIVQDDTGGCYPAAAFDAPCYRVDQFWNAAR